MPTTIDKPLSAGVRAAEPDHQHNNFDLLRLVFASIVVVFHCYDLSLTRDYAWVPHVFSAVLAVQGFFAMSGCLIVGSFDRTPSLRRYFEKRARRILPAYWAALVFTLILGATLSTLPISAFIKSPMTWQYAAANLCFANFLQPSLPGLFMLNPITTAVNGALWTIKIEVLFYLIVPAIVWCVGRFGKWQTLGSIFAMSVVYRAVMDHWHHPTLGAQLPGQLCFFMVGAFAYYYFDQFKRHAVWMWATAAGCYLASAEFDWIGFRAIGVALGVMCVGLLLPSLGRAAKHGDFSYGIYVFHFPVIQSVIAIGLFAARPHLAMGVTLATVAILGFLSWTFVESPSLSKRRVRQTES